MAIRKPIDGDHVLAGQSDETMPCSSIFRGCKGRECFWLPYHRPLHLSRLATSAILLAQVAEPTPLPVRHAVRIAWRVTTPTNQLAGLQTLGGFGSSSKGHRHIASVNGPNL